MNRDKQQQRDSEFADLWHAGLNVTLQLLSSKESLRVKMVGTSISHLLFRQVQWKCQITGCISMLQICSL